jgi:hypothetical protein
LKNNDYLRLRSFSILTVLIWLKQRCFLVRKIAPMTKEEWERLEKERKASALPDTQLNR